MDKRELITEILDSVMIDTEKHKPLSVIKQEFKKMAVFEKIKMDAEKKAIKYDIEDEIFEQITLLKKAEEKKDLAWMEYSSWTLLPNSFKKAFESIINPFMWGAIYFSKTSFVDNFHHLQPFIPDNTRGYCQKRQGNYQIVIHSGDITPYYKKPSSTDVSNSHARTQFTFNKKGINNAN